MFGLGRRKFQWATIPTFVKFIQTLILFQLSGKKVKKEYFMPNFPVRLTENLA
jgi:hypothetical protein